MLTGLKQNVFCTWVLISFINHLRVWGFVFKQELTEEGLPFLILFHNTDDTDIVETYNNEVAKQLLSEKCKCFGMSLWSYLSHFYMSLGIIGTINSSSHTIYEYKFVNTTFEIIIFWGILDIQI